LEDAEIKEDQSNAQRSVWERRLEDILHRIDAEIQIGDHNVQNIVNALQGLTARLKVGRHA
jgi:hypothetical protein